MRILFMGTPDIAAECLKALYAAGHDICGVYTRRDKPVGRKQVLTAPPVKEVALEHGTPVFQPRTLRDGGEDANIQALAPELIVVVAYGCILPASVLQAPRYGCINLHVSLLPKYRGSAPVQWAVLNGDTETGVSIMQMDEGLDTGDVLVCEKMDIGPEETSGELFDRVTAVGARVLCETIPQIAAGTLRPQPQDHAHATLAPMLDKELAEFRLTDSAAHIHDWVRGMNPWPMAWFTTSGGKKVKVTECRAVPSHGEAPGTVLATRPLTVACAEGAIQLLHVVPEGKKPMDGTSLQQVCGSKRGTACERAESPRGGGLGAGEAGAGWLFQPRPGCRTEASEARRPRQSVCQRHFLHGAGTPGHTGLYARPVPAQGPCQAGRSRPGDFTLRSGPGPVYAGARIGGRQ